MERATGIAARLQRLAEQPLAVAVRLEQVARATEQHAASLDRKTGPVVP